MAFLRNDRNEFAWVSNPDETPKRFFATRDEALKNSQIRESARADLAKTTDMKYSEEPGEIIRDHK